MIGLRGNETASSVTGVRLQFRAKPDMLATFDADLVVDASGRASRAPEWLSALGRVRPAETIVDGHLGYPESHLLSRPDNRQIGVPHFRRRRLQRSAAQDLLSLSKATGGL